MKTTVRRRLTNAERVAKRKKDKLKRRKNALLTLLVFGSGILFGTLIARGGIGKVEQKLKNAAYDLDPTLLNSQQVLVLGTDQSSGSTDVMFTVSSDGSTTHIEQIPRDTLVDNEKYGIIKANSLYTLMGPEKTEAEISKIIGKKVDHFARVNLNAIRMASDAIDGVEIKVPTRMHYDDYSQKLHIDLYPGRQMLKGTALEGYIRYRNDGLGDIGRLERQQQVYRALFQKLLSANSLIHLPGLIEVFKDDVKTDLSPIEVGALLGLMKGSKLSIHQLKGEPIMYKGLSYWLAAGSIHPR